MLSVALKEWDLVISEMLGGRQCVLLRKGGILEAENQFELEHRRFWFYPTFVHQDPRMVRAEFRSRIRKFDAEPGEVELRGFGEVAGIFEVPGVEAGGRGKMDALRDLHIWDEPLIAMRFAYRPEKPLYLVVVRAYRLPGPVRIANSLEYAGCKSWVPLKEGIEMAGAAPALSDEKLRDVVERVSTVMAKG